MRIHRTGARPRLAVLSTAIAALCLTITPALGTVTVEICFEDGRLAGGSVGILVADVAGNGFHSPEDPSAVGTALVPGQKVGDSDDLILAAFQADDGDHWQGGAGIFATVSALDYGALGISEGTPLVLYFFPEIVQVGQRLVLGDQVVTYRNDAVGGSGGTSGFFAPADPGVYALAALGAPLGGDFDPGSPEPAEYGETSAGITGGGGGGDDHGDRRSGSTATTPGGPATPGMLAPGDLDFFSFPVSGPSEVTVYTTGAVDTLGYLFAPDGTPLNDPARDDDRGIALNFLSREVVDANGLLDLAVRGKGDAQSGDYEVHVKVRALPEYRTDVTVGRAPARQIGEGVYNASANGQRIRKRIRKLPRERFFFTGQNDGGLEDRVGLRGSRGNRYFRVVYFRLSHPAGNVTGQLVAGTYRANLPGLGEESFRMFVKGTRRLAREGRARSAFRVSASSPGGGVDRVETILDARLKSKRQARKRR